MHTDSIMPVAKPQGSIHIAVFASGAGSNALQLIRFFAGHHTIKIALIVCNKPGAGVLAIAGEHHVPTVLIHRDRFFDGDCYLPVLQEQEIDMIVLAGFLWKVPMGLISAFPHRIINIHPALLPKFGGKGMYGKNVHEAVLAAGEKESGITIHYVDGHYDNGDIILQVRCPVEPTDTAATLAGKIHGLEHSYYPRVVKDLAEKLLSESST